MCKSTFLGKTYSHIRHTLCSLPLRGVGAGCILFLLALSVNAQDKVISNTRMVGVGGIDILDTYLSQEKYTGTEVRYISHTIREREGKPLSRLIVHQGFFDYARNRADNSNEMGGTYKFSYGLLYGWKLYGDRIDLRVGGMADLTVGFLYNTRNSNNPAQARLNLDIAPTAMAAYRFKAGRVPMKACYEVSAPLCGLMFSPNFGQSYYEIFSEGDYDHNVVPTTFVATPSLRQMLSLDVSLGKTTLRLGYLGDWRQSKVNGLKYHSYSNMFMIGITRSFKMIKMQP